MSAKGRMIRKIRSIFGKDAAIRTAFRLLGIDWEESDSPRDESGKFTSGGSSSAGKSASNNAHAGAKSADRSADQNYRPLAQDGGPGSGNFGHKGRPGKVGGSGEGGGKAFRIQEQSGSYIGVQRAKAFKSIARQARSSKDLDSFVHSFSREQYHAVVGQWRASGTKEKLPEYTERLRQIMSKQKPDKMKPNRIVEGKDLTDSDYKPSKEPYTDPTTGQLVDTEIEDVMSKQGYLGVPKVVTQEEFDKITAENPNMPILYRSYAASNADILQDYDDMLDGGEWYVDCETGGAQYGQGMYCAGVYPKEELYKWDDPAIKNNELIDTPVVFTDRKGNGFVTKGKIQKPDSSGDLIIETPYMLLNKDGTRQMIQMDENGVWEDVNTGAMIPDEQADTLIEDCDSIVECKDQDLGIYKDAYEKDRKEGKRRALTEMEHYRNLSMNRIMEETHPIPPEGMRAAGWWENGDKHYHWFDPNKTKAFESEKPPKGTVIAIVDPRYDKPTDEKAMWLVSHGIYDGKETDMLKPLDGGMPMPFDEIDPKWTWAEIGGECEEPDIHPTASTRMMTLDPSAKMVTYREVRDLARKSDDVIQQDKNRRAEEESKFFDNELTDDSACESILYRVMMGMGGTENLSPEGLKKVAKWKETHPDRVEKVKAFADRQAEQHRKAVEEAKKYEKYRNMDLGVLAAYLGYDAINAEGHGASDSYTVVLNRTKLIISEQRVSVE